MGLKDIHIAIHGNDHAAPNRIVQTVAEILIVAHNRGEHQYGRMIRECPLCQQER